MLSSNIQSHRISYPIRVAVCTGLGHLITILAPTSRLSKTVNEIAHAAMAGIGLKYGNNGFAYAASFLYVSSFAGFCCTMSSNRELAASFLFTAISSMTTGFGFIDRD